MNEWLGPLLAALSTIVTGAVVWGIQLNYMMLKHTSQISFLEKQFESHEIEARAYFEQANKTATILDHVEKRLERLDRKFDKHDEASDEWRQRVLILEAHNGVNGVK